MVFTGYTVRMVDAPQIGDGGKSIRMFCLEGGGMNPNPTVSKYVDFAYFEFSPRGFTSAALWLTQRGQVEFAQLLTDIAPEQESDGRLMLPEVFATLPTDVPYEDVYSQVPQGRILIGVGLDGIKTVSSAAGALVWVIGCSGSGKTNTVVSRVEERSRLGHKFLGYDPHWVVDGSLTSALSAYSDLFLHPLVGDVQGGKAVLQMFLDEFDGRKSGRIPKPWQPLTILVNEIDCLMHAVSEGEEDLVRLLRRVARVCGQEGHAFHMQGIYVSQGAMGLAWLRTVATLVMVHRVFLSNDKILACNGNKAVVKDMDCWPVGRTYVYGAGLDSVVQQPRLEKSVTA